MSSAQTGQTSGGGGGDATAANQVTGNTSLASIDTKLTSPLSTRITDGTNNVSPLVNFGSNTNFNPSTYFLPVAPDSGAILGASAPNRALMVGMQTDTGTVSQFICDSASRLKTVSIFYDINNNYAGPFVNLGVNTNYSSSTYFLPVGVDSSATLGSGAPNRATMIGVQTPGGVVSQLMCDVSSNLKVTAIQSGAWILSANSGVDIGDVTINNASGASAVNIQDGGNSITVDNGGTFAVQVSSPLPAGTNSIGIVDTELPAASALADATSNPTTPLVGAAVELFNGTTWDRARGDTANGLDVDVTRVNGNVTVVQATASNLNATITGTVTANAGTNLNTSALALETGGNLASIKTNTDNLNFSQASTTSGQKGSLIMGAVTTAAPSYTTAQTNPLSLTTSGALRTDSSATTQPVSGTVTANAGTGNFTVVQATASNLNAIVRNQDGSGNDLTSSTSAPGGTEQALIVRNIPSGTQTVSGTVTANAGTNLNTSALALSATQTDRTQKTQITDGTRDGTIKAASTAATATDTSLVVALSPNSPLPTGTNTIGALTANQTVNVAQIAGTTTSTGAGTTNAGVQRVVLPTDQSAIPATQSGTWTVQPGNTANTTPWLMDLRRGQTISFATIDTATSGDNTIVAADATRKIKVLSYSFVCSGTVNTRWKSGAASNLSGAMAFIANTGISSPVGTPGGGHLLETAVNQALVLNLSAAIQVSGHISYFLET